VRLEALLGLALVLGASTHARADNSRIPDLVIARVEGGIVLDGELTEPLWQQAARVEEWYEVAPGDNIAPKVKTIGYLAYDDRYLYVGFDCRDPDPRRIRAPLADRDSLTGNVDHGGILIDSRNDGRTAMIFAASASGVQYDSIWDDAVSTDDTSPDFYWEAAAHIGQMGWTLEMRIPFSSLRYTDRNPASWHIMLYRIYPRDFWYQMLSTTWPRGVDCWVCRSNRLTGLHDLPRGGGLVAAPYLSGKRTADPESGPGSPLAPAASRGVIGADVKWTPSASHAFDVTLKPDFSQIEADTAQISANERFALFYPEKRPFFLEGRDLFSTPIRAIYTRTITSPEWGARATGRFGQTSYTALISNDRGGGSVILPGPTESEGAAQDFHSYVFIGRVRHDFGRSFAGLVTTNLWIEGGGENHVFGPDFQWRPNLRDTVTGQWLLSSSTTPNRPDLVQEWDGRHFSGHAGELRWFRSTSRFDWLVDYKDVSAGFRADNGFVPQVGYREGSAEAGWIFRPEGFLTKLRIFGLVDYTVEPGAGLLNQDLSLGFNFRGAHDSGGRIRVSFARVRTGPIVLPRTQLVFDVSASPSRRLTAVQLTGTAGDAIDFDNHRTGSGTDISAFASIQATKHLEFRLNASRRFVNVRTAAGDEKQRLFTAQIERVRATYAFTRRALLRIVAQHVETRRQPALYTVGVVPRSANLDVSALFSYKLNWQTVLFVGYGDARELAEDDRLAPVHRELFLKVSYAFQR